jgi:hypothetical protein
MKLTAELKLVWYFWSENWRLLVWLNKKLGDLASIREVSSMSEANQTAAQPTVNQQIQKKLAELAELISIQEYGPVGPAKELTFREI